MLERVSRARTAALTQAQREGRQDETLQSGSAHREPAQADGEEKHQQQPEPEAGHGDASDRQTHPERVEPGTAEIGRKDHAAANEDREDEAGGREEDGVGEPQ